MKFRLEKRVFQNGHFKMSKIQNRFENTEFFYYFLYFLFIILHQ
jgi:hypothetical protein